jgi:hypothetical protein
LLPLGVSFSFTMTSLSEADSRCSHLDTTQPASAPAPTSAIPVREAASILKSATEQNPAAAASSFKRCRPGPPRHLVALSTSY